MFTFAALIEYSVAAYLEKRKTILQQSQQGADLESRLEMVSITHIVKISKCGVRTVVV